MWLLLFLWMIILVILLLMIVNLCLILKVFIQLNIWQIRLQETPLYSIDGMPIDYWILLIEYWLFSIDYCWLNIFDWVTTSAAKIGWLSPRHANLRLVNLPTGRQARTDTLFRFLNPSIDNSKNLQLIIDDCLRQVKLTIAWLIIEHFRLSDWLVEWLSIVDYLRQLKLHDWEIILLVISFCLRPTED
jgi:hypothetical protein